MKKAEVEIGGQYIAKVSNKLAVVKIMSPSIYGGWIAVNVKTQREVRIKTAARLRRPAGGKFIVACDGRYLTAEPRWVEDFKEAKKFTSIVEANMFFTVKMKNSLLHTPGVKIQEVAA